MQLMRVKNYKLGRESLQSQLAARRNTPAQTVAFKHKGKRLEFVISAGTRDDVLVYRMPIDNDSSAFYVLSINRPLCYCGIERFDMSGRSEGDLFLQYSQDVEAVLGKSGLDLSTATVARRLIAHLNEVFS